MSGSQHNPNGRQSQLGSGWSPLQLQMANLLARAPQAHMASDRGVTWHTPTPPPHLYHVPAPSPPDPLQAMKSASGNSVFRHTATPPELYRHTPTPPDKHLIRHTPSPGDGKAPIPPVDLYPHLGPARDKLRGEELGYGRVGVDLSLGSRANGQPPALSVRDAPTINSLIARAAPRRVDTLLERLAPSPHSVIVHPRPHHTPSPPSSNEDSGDSCGGAAGSKRKRKPERTVRVTALPHGVGPAPGRLSPAVVNGEIVHTEPNGPGHEHAKQRRKTRSGSAETIADIAAMIAGADSGPAVDAPPPALTVDTLKAVLDTDAQPSAVESAAAPRRLDANLPVESPSEGKPAESDRPPSTEPTIPTNPLPDHTKTLPDHVKPLPDHAKPMPEHTKPMPEHTKPLSDHTKPLPEQTNPLPEHANPLPEHANPLPEHTKPLSEQTEPVPSQHGNEQTQPTTEQSQPLNEQSQPASEQSQPASEQSNEPAAAFVEVENQLEKMFAGIEEEPPVSTPPAKESAPRKKRRKCSTGRGREAPPRRKGPRKKPAKAPVRERDGPPHREGYDSGSNASSGRSRGPYIQIRGPRDSPVSVCVMNAGAAEEETESRRRGGEKRRGLHASTLGLRYDASTRDATWLCVFCARGPHADSLGDLFGPYPLDGPDVWLHADCAIWAPGVLAAGTRIWGLSKAIKTAASVRCQHCQRTDASVACSARSCPARAHFPCARDNAWRLSQDDFRAMCPRHAVT